MYVILIVLVLGFLVSRRGYQNAGAIFVGIYAITAVCGYLGFRVFSFAYGMPFRFGDSLSVSHFVAAEFAFLVAVLAFVAGYMMLSERYGKARPQSQPQRIRSRRPGTISTKNAIAMAGFIVSVSLLLAAYGWVGIFERSEYLPNTINRVFKSLGILLTPGVLVYAHYYKVPRSALVIFYLSYLLLFFGMGSRSLVLLPISYVMASFFSPGGGIGLKKLSISAGATILLVSIALSVRDTSTHGVIPYAQDIVSNGLEEELMLLAFNYVSAFSYSLTAYLSDSMYYEVNYLWVSLDPRLGFMIGWPAVSENLKINPYAPYNTISELYFFGWSVVGAYYFAIGSIFALCERYSRNRSRILHFVVYISVLFFTIYSLQYNLRSSTRIIYYILAVFIAVIVIRSILLFLQQRNAPTIIRTRDSENV